MLKSINNSHLIPLLLVAIATIMFRSIHFGNPDVDFDEQFYVLVGHKMWSGSIPYIDLWDRKPVGLFVLYALIQKFGPNPFFSYLFVAALFAAATAAMIQRIASRWISPWAAVLPALLYVVWQEPFYGSGGQTAIFYNLLTVLSFWLVLRARDARNMRNVFIYGLVAMGLMGVALQIKYTVLPEGIFFGLGLLYILLRRGISMARLLAVILIFAATALLPTLIAMGYYWHIGHLDDFFYANFVSLFQRGHLRNSYIFSNLRYIFIVSLPLDAVAILGMGRLYRGDQRCRADFPWMLGWIFAATLGFVMIGNFYYHYFMPMLLILALASAAILRETRWGTFAFVILLLWPSLLGRGVEPRDDRSRIASMNELTRIIRPRINADHCLYVFDGSTALYQTTDSCLPTKFVYPDHLSNDVEREALGTNAKAELQRVLNRKPGVIITATPALVPVTNQQNVNLMQTTLQRDYYVVAKTSLGWRTVTVWGLRNGPGSRSDSATTKPNGPVVLYPPDQRWPQS